MSRNQRGREMIGQIKKISMAIILCSAMGLPCNVWGMQNIVQKIQGVFSRNTAANKAEFDQEFGRLQKILKGNPLDEQAINQLEEMKGLYPDFRNEIEAFIKQIIVQAEVYKTHQEAMDAEQNALAARAAATKIALKKIDRELETWRAMVGEKQNELNQLQGLQALVQRDLEKKKEEKRSLEASEKYYIEKDMKKNLKKCRAKLGDLAAKIVKVETDFNANADLIKQAEKELENLGKKVEECEQGKKNMEDVLAADTKEISERIGKEIANQFLADLQKNQEEAQDNLTQKQREFEAANNRLEKKIAEKEKEMAEKAEESKRKNAELEELLKKAQASISSAAIALNDHTKKNGAANTTNPKGNGVDSKVSPKIKKTAEGFWVGLPGYGKFFLVTGAVGGIGAIVALLGLFSYQQLNKKDAKAQAGKKVTVAALVA